MKLALKVNLVLLAVAAIVIELFTAVSTPILEGIARAKVLQKARIMMEAAAGIPTYTLNEIAPLLAGKAGDDKFYTRSVPAYAATKKLHCWQENFATTRIAKPHSTPSTRQTVRSIGKLTKSTSGRIDQRTRNQ